MTSAWGHYRPVADKHFAPAGMLGLAPAADVLRLPKLPLTGTYRAVRKHADRTLAEFEWRFNRRYDLAAMIPRLAWAATRTPPMPYRLLKMADSGG